MYWTQPRTAISPELEQKLRESIARHDAQSIRQLLADAFAPTVEALLEQIPTQFNDEELGDDELEASIDNLLDEFELYTSGVARLKCCNKSLILSLCHASCYNAGNPRNALAPLRLCGLLMHYFSCATPLGQIYQHFQIMQSVVKVFMRIIPNCDIRRASA